MLGINSQTFGCKNLREAMLFPLLADALKRRVRRMYHFVFLTTDNA